MPNLRILAIDPGPVQSAYVLWDGEQILNADKHDNSDMLKGIQVTGAAEGFDVMVIEQVCCYGMPVGEEVFETVFWSGRFWQACGLARDRLPRQAVKLHLCHSTRASDGNIRQALIDLYGKPPTKANPNPIYNGHKISKDMWQAWALAVTYGETREKAEKTFVKEEASCTTR